MAAASALSALDSDAESAEAAAILAERQASALREERDAAQEEVGLSLRGERTPVVLL